MVRAYSNDLRERVAASVALGRTCRETADLFGVSVSSVVKWSQRQRSTGTAAALPMGGSRGRSLAAHRDWLLKRIAVPGMTVRLLAVELRDQGIAASPTSIWRALKEAGFSFKKNVVRKRAGSARNRAKA
jgi:transposase